MLDYSRIGKWAKVIYLVLAGISILSLLVNGVGFMHNIWLDIPFYGHYNLSSFFPLFVPLYGAVPYMKDRIQFWLHPFQVESDYQYGRFTWDFLTNNQWIGMNRLMDSGEWTADKLPAGNDYTLAYISTYYGILAAIVVVGLIVLLFWRGFHLSVLQKNQLGMIMGRGCAIVLLVQFVFYVLCNSGFLPSAIYCPFITYGGAGMLTTYILLGIMLSVYRYQNVTGEIKTNFNFYTAEKE